MSLFRITRRNLLGSGGAALALAGCGFQPASSPTEHFGRISFRAPNKDPFEYELRHAFAQNLGEPQKPLYYVDYQTNTQTEDLAITQNNITTRKRVHGDVRATLQDIRTQQTIDQFVITRTASFSTSSDRFASDETEEETRRRLAENIGYDLANLIRASIIRHEKNATKTTPVTL